MKSFYINNRNNYPYAQSMTGVFCRNLRNKLKTSIKGEIKCHTVGDTLIVDIYGVNGVVFRHTHENITSEIVQGFASDTLAIIIHKRYKKYITNLFFL